MTSPPACMSPNVVLAPYTTMGLGGPARLFARCTNLPELRESLAFARKEGLPVQVFSGGSNIIFADDGFDGVVVHVGLRGRSEEINSDEVTLAVAAGEPWDSVVARAVGQGWGGIECLSGIPGSTGGTPVQNVGAYGQDVGQTIVSVRTLDRITLEEKEFPHEACGFGYRMSRFKGADANRHVITGVRFRLKRRRTTDIRYPELARELEAQHGRSAGEATPGDVREAVLSLRRRKSMLIDPSDENSRSVGSFFTNPVVPESFLGKNLKGVPVPTYPAPAGIKLSAAWLVEHAGFPKGYRAEGAGISEHHALAIVNRGGTTEDVMTLEREIRDKVYTKFGVRLEREPVVVPHSPA